MAAVIGRMTLRVGRYDAGGKLVFGPTRRIRVNPVYARVDEDVFRYPPCRCPRHRAAAGPEGGES